VVVGIPDPRFGETICAVVEPSGTDEPALEELKGHVTGRLAAYKAPRNVVVVDSIARAANGKVDYKRLKAVAMEQLGVS
jgi:fatty-acyl-CoA synthase